LAKFTEFTFKRSGSLFPQITRHAKRKTVLTIFNSINNAYGAWNTEKLACS